MPNQDQKMSSLPWKQPQKSKSRLIKSFKVASIIKITTTFKSHKTPHTTHHTPLYIFVIKDLAFIPLHKKSHQTSTSFKLPWQSIAMIKYTTTPSKNPNTPSSAPPQNPYKPKKRGTVLGNFKDFSPFSSPTQTPLLIIHHRKRERESLLILNQNKVHSPTFRLHI